MSYLPDTLETVSGQDILVDEFGMGAFSMVVVEDMEMKDVQKLEEKFSEVEHVKDVLWYDDVADITSSGGYDPGKFKKSFLTEGNATMMLRSFDNTTSSDDAMEALTEMRKIADQQCFISGMTGIVNDIKTRQELIWRSHCSSPGTDRSGDHRNLSCGSLHLPALYRNLHSL